MATISAGLLERDADVQSGDGVGGRIGASASGLRSPGVDTQSSLSSGYWKSAGMIPTMRQGSLSKVTMVLRNSGVGMEDGLPQAVAERRSAPTRFTDCSAIPK